jgi:hypothetical protein
MFDSGELYCRCSQKQRFRRIVNFLPVYLPDTKLETTAPVVYLIAVGAELSRKYIVRLVTLT